MLDRATTEATIYRVAVCAFTYYANKPLDEPGYSVDEDVTWCLAPLKSLDTSTLAELRDRIASVITKPDADRRAFIADIYALASE